MPWLFVIARGSSFAFKDRAYDINGRMRDELLNESLFIDLDQARQLISAWVADYNTARPHSSLGYKTPAAYAGTLIAPKGVTSAEALAAAG